MAIAHRVSGTPTPERSDRVGRKRDGIPWHSPLTQVVKGALYRVFGWLELPAGYRYTTRAGCPVCLRGGYAHRTRRGRPQPSTTAVRPLHHAGRPRRAVALHAAWLH